MKALTTARSIQALHMSSSHVDRLTKKAQTIFGRLLHTSMENTDFDDEIPDDWNDMFKVPRLQTDDITSAVTSSILGNKAKEQCARHQNPDIGYSEQRLVLSRLMGRDDINRNKDWFRYDERDSFGRPYDVRQDLEPEIQKEIELGRRKPSDLFWTMSRECWICEMWSYYLPIISQQDISESYGGLSQTLH